MAAFSRINGQPSVLAMLAASGFKVGIHFEDDPLQQQIIEQAGLSVTVVRIQQQLVTLENTRHVFTE